MNKIYNFKMSVTKCMVTLRYDCIFTLHHKPIVNETHLEGDNNFLTSILQLKKFSSVFLVIV